MADLSVVFDATLDYLAKEGLPERAPGDWKADLEAGVAELNRDYFVAAMGGSVRVASMDHDGGLDRKRLVFMREQEFRLLYAHRRLKFGETKRGDDRVGGLVEIWLNHPDRRTYRRIAMIPDGPCPADTFNLWHGFGVKPRPGDWSTIEWHIREVICSGNEEHYNWLRGWCAYCVQNPGKQAETSVVMRGIKGLGKGLFGQMMLRIFKNHSLHITQAKHLTGNFNSHLANTVFLFSDEAYWAGDKQSEGVLQGLITERTLMIEPKGVDAHQMPNMLKILQASNNDWVVPASPEERRFLVLDVSECRRGDKPYFDKVGAAIAGDELPAFLDHLLKLDLTGFNHRNPPHTAALNHQKLLGATSIQKFWLDCLETGGMVNTGSDDKWPDAVDCNDLHAAYLEHARDLGNRYPLTNNHFGAELRKLCPKNTLAVRRPWETNAEGKRPREYVLGTLDEHRAAFLSAMKIDTHVWGRK
jgi:Family of unknown function (DUF5906)